MRAALVPITVPLICRMLLHFSTHSKILLRYSLGMPQFVFGNNSFSRLSFKGILLYKLVPSNVKNFSFGKISILSNFLKKSEVSLIYDFIPVRRGCRIMFNIKEILYVLETIGLQGYSVKFL